MYHLLPANTTQPLPQPRQVTDVWRVPQSAHLIGPAIIAGQNLRMLHAVLTVRIIALLYCLPYENFLYENFSRDPVSFAVTFS